MAAALVLIGPGLSGCSMGVKRDLSKVKPQEVIFDDMCGLQPYFDALEGGKLRAPEVIAAREIEKEPGKPLGGQQTFRFQTDFQKNELRRVLGENWDKVPDQLVTAETIELDVRWAHKAGVARLVTGEDAQIATGGQRWSLPYHQCLSDLLYGAPLYKTRRAMLEPPAPLPPAPPPAVATSPSLAGDAPAPQLAEQATPDAAPTAPRPASAEPPGPGTPPHPATATVDNGRGSIPSVAPLR